MARIFITSSDDYAAADTLRSDYAAQLRAQGLTPSHRIAVEPHAHSWWVVLVIDEPGTEPDD